MKPEGALWQSLRADQDRARTQAAYLAQAKANRQARPGAWSRRQPRRRWARKRPLVVAGALAVACAVALAVSLRVRGLDDLRFSVGTRGDAGHVGAWIAAPSGSVLPLQFSDGSRFSLDPEARARVAGTDARGAHLVLEKGRATVSVVPRKSSHWRVDVGPFEVAVVGTRFDVSWEPNEEVFQLRLEQGSVLVSGSFLREPQRLAQGQVLRAFCRERRQEIVEIGSEARLGQNARWSSAQPSVATDPLSAAGAALPSANVQAEAENPRQRAPQAAKPTWQKLVSAGEFQKALEIVERTGFEAECRHASGEDLLALGDAARLTGKLGRAREAYLAARSKLAGGGRTAYGLGLLAFDQKRDFVEAARWFDLYLREQPEGNLRREAEGRLMEAWQRAGESAKARAVAVRYLRDYPSGTQAALARELTSR